MGADRRGLRNTALPRAALPHAALPHAALPHAALPHSAVPHAALSRAAQGSAATFASLSRGGLSRLAASYLGVCLSTAACTGREQELPPLIVPEWAASLVFAEETGGDLTVEALAVDHAKATVRRAITPAEKGATLLSVLFYRRPLLQLGLTAGRIPRATSGESSEPLPNAEAMAITEVQGGLVERAWSPVGALEGEARAFRMPTTDPLRSCARRGGCLAARVETAECVLPCSYDGALSLPRAPDPPNHQPCPLGWRWQEADEVCEPWPAAGRAVCAPGEHHLPGAATCTTIGRPCSEDGWPVDDPPEGRRVLHIDRRAADAQGADGSRASPFASVGEAVEALTLQPSMLALAAGTYEEFVELRHPDLIVRGACSRDTVLRAPSTPSGTWRAALHAEGVVEIEDMTIEGGDAVVLGTGNLSRVTLRGLIVRGSSGSGTAHLQGSVVALDSRIERNALSAIDVRETAEFTGHRLSIDANLSYGLYARPSARAKLTGSVISENDIAVVLAGGIVEVFESVVEDQRTAGILLAAADPQGAEATSSLTIADSVLRSTAPLAVGDGSPRANRLQIDHGTAIADRVWIKSADPGHALTVSRGGHLTLRHATIDDCGLAVGLWVAGTVDALRTRFRRCSGPVVELADAAAAAELHDLEVRLAEGVVVHAPVAGSTVRGRRWRLESSSKLTSEFVSPRGTSPLIFSRGTLHLTDLEVRRLGVGTQLHPVGVLASGQESSEISTASIEVPDGDGVRARDSARLSLSHVSIVGGKMGLVQEEAGSIDVADFYLAGHSEAGLTFRGSPSWLDPSGAGIRARDGTITRCQVGARIPGRSDIPDVFEGVRYLENVADFDLYIRGD